METDFCVIGGGLAGICAAISAARNGARVVLVQDRSVLGGNASSEVKMHVVGADCHGRRPGARETGLLEEFRLEDAFRNPQRVYPMWDLLLYEKVKSEPNIVLLLDSDCDGCTTETADGRVKIVSAHVTRNSTEDKFDIQARFFADCSGDGRLGFEAGAEFLCGREARSDFGEPLALPERDNKTLGNSILFTARKYDTPQPFIRPDWARPFEKREFKFRPIDDYGYGYWWLEWGGQLDTIKDLEPIRHECLRIALGVWDYVKNSGDHPGAANYVLEWVGAIPGKRESRRFLGPHVLVEQDTMSGRTFEDQVAYGGWWLDLHPPEGVDAIDERPCIQHHIPHLYGIPLRSLYSRNVSNLFFAGRNISATHVAFASTRVMGTCSVMGQAVGTAAAACLALPGEAIASSCSPGVLHRIQQTLLRDDAFLPGLRNEDPNDLARTAKCSASSAQDNHGADRVLTGVGRKIRPEWGPWAEVVPNHWESQSLPAWLELELPAASLVSEIHLTFDSGLDRELILSPSDFCNKKGLRGAQPELVEDYDISANGSVILSVRDNCLRKRVHRFGQPLNARRIRFDLLSARGVTTARVFEVRLYA
ncbi:MAG: FAD-dependent oxidoreductase [Verrucomicrobiota bacterium]